nr:MAG TPA: hypothetical protein [Caudoviricetes sp.]
MPQTTARPIPFNCTGPIFTAAPLRPLIIVTAVSIIFFVLIELNLSKSFIISYFIYINYKRTQPQM